MATTFQYRKPFKEAVQRTFGVQHPIRVLLASPPSAETLRRIEALLNEDAQTFYSFVKLEAQMRMGNTHVLFQEITRRAGHETITRLIAEGKAFERVVVS